MFFSKCTLLTTLASLSCLASGQATQPWPLQGHVLRTQTFTELKKQAPATSNVTDALTVYPPVLTVDQAGQLVATNADPGATTEVVAPSIKSCQQTLVVHSFANSYGDPYVGTYNPPPCDFNSVTWNLTTQTSGIQYDRMGTVSFGNIELFRTTTIEPDINVTQYTYLKDMSPFLSLFHSQQEIIFDLPNIIDPSINITGDYNVTLTATYFTVETSYVAADKIFSISQDLGSEGQPSYFTFPQQNASNSVTLPRNIKKAVYTITATGQAEEEFWWAAFLNNEVNTFPDDPSYGFSPFREVELYIDGKLAGVAWPFSIIFSGGVDPVLWSPIGGIDILDLKEYEIDITPWLPLLCDGKPHTFDMVVSGLNNTGTSGEATLSETVMDDWFLGGKIFVWSDKAGHITTGSGPHITEPAPTLDFSSSFKTNRTGANTSLTFDIEAQRHLNYQSTIKLSTGTEKVSWSQKLNYSANALITQAGNIEKLNILTTGYESSSSGYARNFGYPFYYKGTETIIQFLRGKDVTILGQPVFPTGLETFFSNQTGKGSSAEIEQSAINNNGSVSTSTSLTFSVLEYGNNQGGGGYGWPSYASMPAIASNQTLFTQHATAKQGVLTSDQTEFLVKPQIEL